MFSRNSRQQLDKIGFNSIKVGDSVINAVDNVLDLGAYSDSNISMKKHIDVKCSDSVHQVGLQLVTSTIWRESLL